MRIVPACFTGVLALTGCGGEVGANASDTATTSADAGVTRTCDPNQGVLRVGSVPGRVVSVHRAGSDIYAVTDVDNRFDRFGTLFRVESDGSATPLTDGLVDAFNVANVGGTLGFFRGSSRAAAPDDGFDIIDSTGDLAPVAPPNGTPSFVALTSDGTTFDWLELGPAAGSSLAPMLGRGGGSTPISLALLDGVAFGEGNIVGDGQRVFGEFLSNGSGNIESFAIDGSAPMVLDPKPAAPAKMLGVDDENLYYVTDDASTSATLWSVSKFGNGPPSPIAFVPPGSSSTMLVARGSAYWLAPNFSEIMTEPLTSSDIADAAQPLRAPSTIGSNVGVVHALGVDECGLLVAVAEGSTDDAPAQSAILRMPLD